MNPELNILSFATQAAGMAVQDGTSSRAELERWLSRVDGIDNPLFEQAKREVTMALKAAIRYQKSQRPLEAKLTRKHIEKVADEFERVTRLVQRKEGAKNGV